MNISKFTPINATVHKKDSIFRAKAADASTIKEISSEFKQHKIETMEDALRYSGYFKNAEILPDDTFVCPRALPAHEQIEIYLSKKA